MQQLRNADILATHSAAASIWKGFENSGAPQTSSQHWMCLDDTQYLKEIARLVDAGEALDVCPHCQTINGVITDTWGNRFEIAVRNVDNEELNVVVWSKGPDRVSGTEDDIVVPEEGKNAIATIIGAK